MIPQDFSHQNLRGRSFKGQNLEGANFSHADIRGADFTNAYLKGANFSHATAGLQKRWGIFLVLISYLVSAFSGFIWYLPCAGLVSLIFLKNSNEKAINQLFGSDSLYPFLPEIAVSISLVILVAFFFITIRQGLRDGVVSLVVPIVVSLALAAVGSVTGIPATTGLIAGVITIVLVPVLVATVIGSVAVAIAVTIAGNIAIAGNLAASVIGTGLIGIPLNTPLAIALFINVCGILFNTYIGWRAIKGDEKYSFIRNIAVIFAATGGTSFYGANLTDSDFSRARLKSTDLKNSILTRTNWYRTSWLDLVRTEKTYLQNSEIRQLLITGYGEGKNFNHQDLHGVNLQEAILTDASFIGANLSEANLQDANLSRAKLVQTQLNGTNFTGATLTGAFIEDWGITSHTKFNGVRCEYIYMRLPTKENPDPLRKPDNNKEVFEDGDFGDFIKPIFDTLDLYHNQGVDPRAIAISFKGLAENYPAANLEIVAMEKRGEDKFLLRVKNSDTADKSKLAKEYFDTYNQIKGLGEQEIQLLLAAKDNQIRSLEAMIVTALQKPNFYVETVKMGNVIMNNAGELKAGSITGHQVNINVSGSIGDIKNINQQTGNINSGSIDYIKNINQMGDVSGDIDNVETINQVGSIIENDNIEIKLIKGRLMLVGKPSELLIQVTNFSEYPLNKTLEIELASSAEYKILSSNPIYIPIIQPKHSEEISFLLEMNKSREIIVNYKINGKQSNSAIYINAVNNNPYTYGSPVGDESVFIGRGDELKEIIQAVIKDAKQDILVVGERRTGKTSLLRKLQTHIDKPFIPVEVILNTTERTTEKILGLIFQKIVQTLIKQNLLDESDYTESDFPDLKFVENIKKILDMVKSRSGDLKIVLMLDEADSLLEVKQPSGVINELPQNILRAALQSNEVGNDLRVVMASTTDLAIYMSTRSSPLFNHFRKISLKPLSIEETKKLINNPAAMLDYSYSDSAIQYIISLSGGQPYYCQALCYESFNQALQAKHNPITYEDICIAEKKVFDDLYEAYRSGFWQRFSKEEKYILQNLSKNESINNSNRSKLKRLLDWQIVTEEQGTYSFASGLIQKWTTRALLE